MSERELVKSYYEGYDEDGRLRSRRGMVEFLTTMRYIEKYLFDGARVLEIGAGTGRYSHAVAQMGYEVDAVELVEHNIGLFRANTTEGERVTITQGDATDLSGFADDTYDLTLLLGPMYHLSDESEQRAALSEALRVTKKGGVVFAAYCGSDLNVLIFGFKYGDIDDAGWRKNIDSETWNASADPSGLFVLYRKERIDALMKDMPARRLHYVGTDMFMRLMPEEIDAMDDARFAEFMDYVYAVCEREDMVGIASHMLDIFRKEE